MTELNLRRTWPEIFKYLRTSPNPLRIIEIVNRVRPCCWTFRFTFDNTGRTIVKIDCDRTISNNDARALLDGSLEEIFFADTVSLYQTGKYHTVDFTMRKDLYDTNRNHIGHATFYTSPVLKKNELYTLFGPVDPEQEDWLITKNKDPYWIVEIGSEALKQTTIRGGHTRQLINQLIDSVENARISITESTLFQEYKQKIESEQHIKSAHNLKIRQERARTGNRVLFKGKPLMLVPSNENEVLLLLAKLETLNALPFHEFLLWEYTPRAGIDAIASYQIREVEAQSMFVPIELEYYFENFDDHGHPYHQVNLVTCWDFRKAETAAKLHKHNEWLYEYRNDTSFFIVVLSRIPDLQFEETN